MNAFTQRDVIVTGYWNDTREPFTANCIIGSWDEAEDDHNTFFYFDPDEPIIGDHGDFTITLVH